MVAWLLGCLVCVDRYDVESATEAVKVILALGYRIVKVDDDTADAAGLGDDLVDGTVVVEDSDGEMQLECVCRDVRQLCDAAYDMCSAFHHTRCVCVCACGPHSPMEILTYNPVPIDTHGVDLSPSLLALVELLARNVHEVWAAAKLKANWKCVAMLRLSLLARCRVATHGGAAACACSVCWLTRKPGILSCVVCACVLWCRYMPERAMATDPSGTPLAGSHTGKTSSMLVPYEFLTEKVRWRSALTTSTCTATALACTGEQLTFAFMVVVV